MEAKEEKQECFRMLNVDNIKYKTTLTKKYANRKPYEPLDPRKIVSFIPGTILEIQIEVGQEVEQGQNILVLEAMKMQNQITAPFDGKIKSINIELNQRVPKNHLLIEFE